MVRCFDCRCVDLVRSKSSSSQDCTKSYEMKHLVQGNASQVRKRVLVVDDSITVCKVERKPLLKPRLWVEVAADGMEGLECDLVSAYGFQKISDICSTSEFN